MAPVIGDVIFTLCSRESRPLNFLFPYSHREHRTPCPSSDAKLKSGDAV